jgi:branched-chain amino acid transport system substrate-binding protein
MHRYPRLLSIFLGLSLVAAACGGGGGGGNEGAQGGETKKDPITVGAVFDLSGPTSDVGQPYAQGIKDYVEFKNSKGGLDGHEVKLLSQDYKYQVPQAEQLYSQYVPQGAVAFIGWGTADSEALRQRVNADKIPFISASYSENLADPKQTPYNFFPGPSYSDQMRAVLKYISEQEKGNQTQVAVFYNQSPFGQSPLGDGEAYIKEKGLKIGYKTYAMVTGAPDFVGDLSKAKAEGAKYIIIQNVPSPAAKLLGNIKSQGLQAQVICLNYCGDELLVKLAGDAANGAWGVMPFAPPAAEALQEINGFLGTKGKKLEDNFPPLRYVQGWNTAKVFLEGIEKAAQKGGDIKGPAIKEALETISDFQTGVGPAISFTTERHAGMKQVPLYKVEGGKWTKVSDGLTF